MFQELLVSKRDKLSEQMSEAKKLKENIDKRSLIVAQILKKYLKDNQFSEYLRFIRTKSKLILNTRDVQDKLSHCEEQLIMLKANL